MNFLQPSILWALPIAALPIIIHLINKRRFQTVRFGAMQFLLSADRMNKGYARLRQWLILAARTLAIAALIFAISRPLATAWQGGWLALAAGGDQNTSIIVLDRSPSMDQRGRGGISKRQAGLAQLTESLETLKPSRVVLIASGQPRPQELETLESLASLPVTAAETQSANLPTMLDVAYQYIVANRPSQCDIWIVSDLRDADWKPATGQWATLRSLYGSLPQSIQFHLLAFTERATPDLRLRLENVAKIVQAGETAIQLTLQIEASDDVPPSTSAASTAVTSTAVTSTAAAPKSIPVQLELDGASSEINVPLSGDRIELLDQIVPIDVTQSRGWGRVSLPADRNPSDNEFFFVYDDPQIRKTLIVSEDPQQTRPLEIAASISPQPSIVCQSETVRPEAFLATALDDVSLILWQAPLPGSVETPQDRNAIRKLQSWSTEGGTIIFFPPDQPGVGSVAGCSWQSWKNQVSVSSWVDDQDLLADTRAGESLPLGDLQVDRYCSLTGPQRSLATLSDGGALLARPARSPDRDDSRDAWPEDANLYFFTTTASHSSLAKDGVVLFALVHRALQASSRVGDRTGMFSTAEVRQADPTSWTPVAGATGVLSNAYHRHAGVYRDGERLIAINRTEQEDRDKVLSDQELEALFSGLSFDRIDISSESTSSLVQETWRLFLLLMLAALLIESVLSVPRGRRLRETDDRAVNLASASRSV